ncbi:MAG: 4Fe-4S dicluster domain-containing protein [Nitrospirae bacterium]|nr:4Fe-4S dicluster domain-containing protein [Nitrospirota bacterium]
MPKRKIKLSDFNLMLVVGAMFASIAVGLWLKTGIIFYLYNFSIIGGSLMLGMGLWPLLPRKHKHWARRLSQVLVGGYLFFGLGMGLIYLGFGVIQPENMQIEGFWFWLLAGMSAASVLHYSIAKIIGPLVLNRGWCGWACWTTAVLDLLPWKKSPGRVSGRWGHLRYIHFILVAVVVFTLVYHFNYGLSDTLGIVKYKDVNPMNIRVYSSTWHIPELHWFVAGNIGYYFFGILLAFIIRDNRAFCKYLCPIVGFFKIGSRFSLTKISAEKNKCTDCKTCEIFCPMDVSLTEYIKADRRITSSECVICMTCTSVCPNEALKVSFGFDVSREEHLRNREKQYQGKL